MGSGSGFCGNGWAFANSWVFTSSGSEERLIHWVAEAGSLRSKSVV